MNMAVEGKTVNKDIENYDDALENENNHVKNRLLISFTIVGISFFLIGLIYNKLFPEQIQVGTTFIALAAIIISIPIFKEALIGLFSTKTMNFTEQLIALIVLAAIANGNFISAAIVPLVMSIGHFIEQRSMMGVHEAINQIKRLHARKATLLVNGIEQQVSAEHLKIGDIILVRPGEIIPGDGCVLEGHSSVDQSSVTGESIPEDVSQGSPVFAGTVNIVGLLKLEVTGVGNDTVLGRVQNLLNRAVAAKTPVIKILEQYVVYYLPLILIIAGTVLFITEEADRAISVLIVACPCALVLSSPSAIVAGLAVASRLHILIKNTQFLENVSEIDTLLLDKTGTVTLGELEVTGIKPVGEKRESEILRLAAQCGIGSLHPVSKAVVLKARKESIEINSSNRVEENAGMGTMAYTDEGVLVLGREKWITKMGLNCPPIENKSDSVVWLARDNEVLGAIFLADKIRPEAKDALEAVRKLGVKRFILITGDRKHVAEKVARDMGFDEIIAEVLPEQKLKVVEAEKKKNHHVMMVGDGINDALALARADVGVAIGAMINEAALGSADIALMSNSLERLPQMIVLAKKIRKTIHQNILIGTGFSVFMLVLASVGIINPLAAAFLHNGGVVFVIVNSGRLLKLNESKLAFMYNNDNK